MDPPQRVEAMSLLTELVGLWVSSRRTFVAHRHRQETPDELYYLVTEQCKSRARHSCSTLCFVWPYVYSSNKEEWEEQHNTCLVVVGRLRAEGLNAWCNCTFPPPTVNRDGELEHPDVQHYIDVDWLEGVAAWLEARG
jgi:hypothetical protein